MKFTTTTGRTLLSVTVKTEYIEFNLDGEYVALQRKNGKLTWNTKQLTSSEFAEIKAAVKVNGEWTDWKSDEIAERREAARNFKSNGMWETEDGHFYSDNVAKNGTWFSDQDENRNF